MLNPPFKLAVSAFTVASGAATSTLHPRTGCCAPSDTCSPPNGRARLADLNPHLHCSVIGTCLGTPDLRKLMARFIDVHSLSDLGIHHEAVRLAGHVGPVAKALHKALDQRHEATVRRYVRAQDTAALMLLWEEALRQGEVPGAYWALLTHRAVTSDLRQRVFGDVHMLSHLVGAANRADIRRLVELEGDNADLRDKLDRQQARSQQLLDERDAALRQLQFRDLESAALQARDEAPSRPFFDADADGLAAMMAVQTTRRERADSEAAAAAGDVQRLQQELDHLRQHAQALTRELAAADAQLREPAETEAELTNPLGSRLKNRRVLYVGGRPSSIPTIRELVLRHGGVFQRHDSAEERKGLLESAVAWADLVAFPVDCIDHDSAGRLKRLCAKFGTPFVPLRTAGVASFAAAIGSIDDTGSPLADARGAAICLRHG